MRQWSRASSAIGTAALAVAVVTTTPASADSHVGFTYEDFQARSAQDLMDICTLEESNPDYWEARAFCFGFFQGGVQFHHALTSGEAFDAIACPGPDATVEAAVIVFVDYARANPQHLEEPAMDMIFRAVGTEWPCS